MSDEPSDPFNRPPITGPIRQAIADAFAVVPEGKHSAILAIADLGTGEARLHVAWKVNETWRVGAQVGISKELKPDGYVAVEASW